MAYFVWQGIFLPKNDNSEIEKVFIIEQGQSIKEIARNLEQKGLIKDDILFIFYLLIRNDLRQLQAGEYLLSPSMNVSEIAKKITLGDVIIEKVTIIEGWSVKDIAKYLEYRGFFPAKDFLKVVDYKDFSNDFNFLRDESKTLELQGFLFPDTYFFDSNQKQNPEIVVRRMLERFDEKLTNEIREEIKRQNRTIFEIVIMASMLEKEISAPLDMPDRDERIFQDKRIASDILWRRLRYNMPLQVDATIVYIMKKKGLENERIADHLDIDSPFNTYLHRGLPKGPIANPGIRSIKAAIEPLDNDYFFYLSTPDGETIFSETYQEHKHNIEKYLR